MAAHEEYEDLLALNALDALDAAERALLDAHLATCPACLARAGELRDAVAPLAYLVDPVEPPIAVRTRLLEALGARSEPRKSDAPHEQQILSRITPSSESNVVQFPVNSEHKRRYVERFALIAAAISIAVLGVALLLASRRAEELENQIARERIRIEEQARELNTERETRSLLTAPDNYTAILAGTPEAPRARAKLAVDPRTKRAVLFARDLPPAPAGKQYQLWFIAGKNVLPGGVFTPDATGSATLEDRVPAAAGEVTKQAAARIIFAVTLEPAGGTTSPTGAKYLISSAS